MSTSRQITPVLAIEVDRLEDLPVAVVAFGRELSAGMALPFHHHKRAQFVYASEGVMSVTTSTAAYVVPPQRAVWMPAGISHRIDARSRVSMRSLYIRTSDDSDFPAEVCVLQVAPLLRELVISAVAASPGYEPNSPQERLMAVILDQIRIQPVAALALPMPTDHRLQKIVQSLISNPADQRCLDEWAIMVGASKRTLVRLFPAQTGMSFGAWRQQRRLLRALELLAAGNTVTSVALEVGYENTSAFIAMFQRCLGETPSRYLDTTNN